MENNSTELGLPNIHTPGWAEVQKDVANLKVRVEALTLTFRTMRSQQRSNHGDNQRKAKELMEQIETINGLLNGDGPEHPGLVTHIALLLLAGQTTEKNSHITRTWVQWGLATMIAGVGIIIALLTYYRGH